MLKTRGLHGLARSFAAMDKAIVVDLSSVPAALEGQWVVLNEADHLRIGNGATPLAALKAAGLAGDAAGILLAKIPSGRFPIVA
jgi:hypothetical protein